MERDSTGAAPFCGGATRASARGFQAAAAGSRRDTEGAPAAAADAAAGTRRDTTGLAAAAAAAAGVAPWLGSPNPAALAEQ